MFLWPLVAEKSSISPALSAVDGSQASLSAPPPPHDSLFNTLTLSGMIPETGEEMAGVALPALGAR